MVAVLLAQEPENTAEVLASAPESAYRAGAADALTMSGDTGYETLTRLAADEDLTVRSAAPRRADGRIVPPVVPATYWSCNWCGRTNQLTESDCGQCQFGSIPELHQRPGSDIAR
jgi:hypothetical protein